MPKRTLPKALAPNLALPLPKPQQRTCSGEHNLRPVRVRLLHGARVLLESLRAPGIKHPLDQHLERTQRSRQ